MRYAAIKNNSVVNIIVWDGVEPYDPGPGVTLVEIETDVHCEIGMSYLNGAFVDESAE